MISHEFAWKWWRFVMSICKKCVTCCYVVCHFKGQVPPRARRAIGSFAPDWPRYRGQNLGMNHNQSSSGGTREIGTAAQWVAQKVQETRQLATWIEFGLYELSAWINAELQIEALRKTLWRPLIASIAGNYVNIYDLKYLTSFNTFFVWKAIFKTIRTTWVRMGPWKRSVCN